MKLLVLLEGLKLLEDQNLLPMEINIDSRKIILMLKNKNLHYDSIINACCSALRRIGRPPVVKSFRD